MAELRAVNWLLEQGFEVFRNVCQDGPADLVALDRSTGNTILIDVKFTSILIEDGQAVRSPPRTETQRSLNVRLLLTNADGDFAWDMDQS